MAVKERERVKSARVYPREGLATIGEAAEFLGLARQTVYRLLNTDRLKKRQLEGITDVRISWEDLWQYSEGGNA